MFLCIMDDDTKQMDTRLLLALTRCPQYTTAANCICDDTAIPRSLAKHLSYNFERADKFGRMRCIFQFLITQILVLFSHWRNPRKPSPFDQNYTRHLFLNEKGRNYTILPVNRAMMYMMWLRSYPSYHNHALIFNVSVATVHNEINRCIPIIKRALEHFGQWPTINEQREKRCSWTKLESAVGVIDSTSTEIYHPQIEPQKLYFSGNRHFHAIHAQVVIDNASYICYAEARGDAKQFTIN